MIFGNRLLFKGCMYNFFLKDLFEKYRKLLQQNLDFIVIPNENCCGSPLKNLGYFEEFENLVLKNYKLFKEYSVKEIICLCPACCYCLKNEYKKVLGDKWKVKVKHVSEIILELLDKNKIKPVKKDIVATIHDPCYLARWEQNSQTIRSILQKVGIKIREMKYSKEFTFCCGGGGGVSANFPEITEKIAERRINQALETGAEYLVTNCPMCYYTLKSVENEKIKVLELVEIFISDKK